jgi:hypothetical protein
MFTELAEGKADNADHVGYADKLLAELAAAGETGTRQVAVARRPSCA